ncbi:MAG: competence/damage-inducible protein A [Blastocatellia bacterium]
MKIPTAAILVIGDEILSGKTRDLNAQLLIGELRELGVSLKRIVIIPDDVEVVAASTRELSAAFDLVFTSGGVGPTHDDVTIQGIARAFGAPIVRHPELDSLIRGYFKDGVDESHLRMADLPEGTALVGGAGLSWPIPVCRNVYILPGVPEHFRRKFEAVRERFRVAPFHLHVLYTLEDEFDLATDLTAVAEAHPEVSIGSYPSFSASDYRVKLTLESKDPGVLQRAVEALKARLDSAQFVREELPITTTAGPFGE